MGNGMTKRARLSNRRASESFGFECNGLRYIATVSYFTDGSLAEIFLNNAKAGSHSDSAAKDSAVVASIALQHGVPLQTIRHALLRDARGQASSPLGVALDLLGDGI
jgi:hypothetical protein